MHAVEHPRQHEHQIAQAVEVLPRRVVDGLLLPQGDHAALGAAGDGAAHMRLRGGAGPRGQDELLQPRQLGVVALQRLVQGEHRLGLEQLEARHAQLAAQVEELVLYLHQHRAHIGRHVLAQQQADVGVELIHIPHGVHAQAVFADALIVAQPRGAPVAGAGGDLRESIAHGCCPFVRGPSR